MIQLDDLPDEILLMIFKKMCPVDVLYSLMNVNQRFNTIAHDSIFTSRLILLQHLSDGSVCSLTNSILDPLCSQILPKINHKIKWLHLESSSMERILLATNYSSLDGLILYFTNLETIKHYFLEENALSDLFKNQILSLIFNINVDKQEGDPNIINSIIFQHIIKTFANLKHLNFHSSFLWYSKLSFSSFIDNFSSSTLLELRVKVVNFNDCLYILDGRFDQLRAFYVKISLIQTSSFHTTENLPNLKCFSLYSKYITDHYDELVVPLLHRMINLEELSLYIKVHKSNTFVDGHDLKKNIIDRMLQLNRFKFNIKSIIYMFDQMNLPSNKDIEDTFNDFHHGRVISYIDYFTETQEVQCRIHSYPFSLKAYSKITNNFPYGLLFKYVSKITLYDEKPFEYEFFLRIAQSFPLVEDLILNNMKPQTDKNHNHNLPIIEFPHLLLLDLTAAHVDYIEQFLLDTKTYLSNNINLFVDYRAIEKVTENFTRNTTQINCKQLSSLSIFNRYRIPSYVQEYFPHTKICTEL